MRVVICGGGVIGACLAYFLSLRRIEVIVVERAGVACAASGKAGGFLALDWCDGSPLGPLARRSFALHAALAAQFQGNWGYRRLDTLSAVASARHPLGRPGEMPRPVNWHSCRALGSTHSIHYSGNGLPLVSGRNGRANRPIKNTAHIAMPAGRRGSA